MEVIPYDFKIARPASGCPTFKGYWVKLFCFFDGKTTHTFFHEFDMLDNVVFARQCGVDCSVFVQSILVTNDRFSSIFKEIEDYVHRSDSN